MGWVVRFIQNEEVCTVGATQGAVDIGKCWEFGRGGSESSVWTYSWFRGGDRASAGLSQKPFLTAMRKRFAVSLILGDGLATLDRIIHGRSDFGVEDMA